MALHELSVLIAVYNKENPAFFADCLKSIVEQTLQPTEVVIVGDGPLTQALYDVIESFRPKLNIVYHELEQNYGAGRALAEGIQRCRCQIIARVDSDDISYSNRFEVQLAYLKAHPSISVVGGYLSEFVEKPGDTDVIKSVPLDPEGVEKFSRRRNPMNHPSVMYLRDHVIRCGSYKSMLFFEDYYLWKRMIHHGYKLANIGQPLVYFRANPSSIRRRRGFSYAMHELAFLNTLVKDGLVSRWNYLVLVLQRFPVRMMPFALVSSIYKFVLRR